MVGKKKKKPATNPARGFATVSLPSKPKATLATEEEPTYLAQQQSTVKQKTEAQDSTTTVVDYNSQLHNESSKDILEMTPGELEYHLEEAELQKLVDEHAFRVRDDAVRQVTRLEKDRRISRQQAEKAVVNGLTEELLDHVLLSDSPLNMTEILHVEHQPSKVGDDDVDVLLNLWTLQETLQQLKLPLNDDVLSYVFLSWKRFGFRTSNDCLPGLHEAFLWYAYYTSANELPDYDTGVIESKRKSRDHPSAGTSTEPLIVQPGILPPPPPELKPDPTDNVDHLLDANSDASDELSEYDDDPDQLVHHWINAQTVKFRLESNHQINSIKSEKGRQKILERLQRIESDPLFDGGLAHQRWHPIFIGLQKEAGQKRKAVKQSEAVTKDKEYDDVSQLDNFDTGDAFADMFEEANPSDVSTSNDNEALLNLHDFGKWSGVHPYQLLKESIETGRQQGRLKYKSLAKSSYSTRLQLDIAWEASPDVDQPSHKSIPEGIIFEINKDVWHIRMELFATKNAMQGEAFLATLALFLLAYSGKTTSKSWQRLPTVWKNLFTSFEEARQKFLNVAYLANLRHLREIVHNCRYLELAGATEGMSDRLKKSPVKMVTGHHGQRLSAEAATQTWRRVENSAAFKTMRPGRRALPVFEYKDLVLKTFDDNQILIICADTGAGKSTQIPAYILEHQLGDGKDCNIVVAQPRRISAISIARRVSTELGEGKDALGTSRSVVGYAIRLENKTSPETRLTFATTGVILRMLQASPNLDDIDCLVLDEVHERTVDLDLLLIAVKQLRWRRKDLKIVLMSATVDATKFSSYFDDAPVLNIPGRTFHVETGYLEDAVEETSGMLSADSEVEESEQILKESTDSDELEQLDDSSDKLKDYSTVTRRIIANYNYTRVDYGLIVKLASAIATLPKYQMYSSAILIFMPGIGEIRRLYNILLSKDLFSTRWIIHMLHSSFSTQELEQAFLTPPSGYRKIVIATNIAETGITIPDITAVIDTCKEKVMRFDERRQVSRLTEGLISRASAKQRRGRAARVREGLCFHLVTKRHFEMKMPEQAAPEMLRLGLQDPILRVKDWNLGPVEEVFATALDPPTAKNIRRALSKLQDIGAIDGAERLTALGAILAKLPLDVALGKMAVFGVCFQCLEAVVTIIATFSVKSVFLDDISSANVKRDLFARGDSDFLTTYNAYSGWTKACRSNTGQQFCRKYHLSHLQLQLVEEQKTQLLIYLVDAKLIQLNPLEASALNRAKTSRSTRFDIPARFNRLTSDSMISAVLALALYPKLLRREGQIYRNVYTNQLLQLAPTSINKSAIKLPNWLCYLEAAQTKHGRLNVSHTSRVSQATLGLLLGEADFNFFSGVVDMDHGRIQLSFRDWREILGLQRLRFQVSRIVKDFLVKPGILPPDTDQKWLNLMADALNGAQQLPNNQTVRNL